MTLAVISGGIAPTGLAEASYRSAATPFGAASSPVFASKQEDLLRLARHGEEGTIAPHLVNYRANLWLLKEAGCSAIIALHTVGGIVREAATGSWVLPDQAIDYTHGRVSTFAGSVTGQQLGIGRGHIEFGSPFAEDLAEQVMQSAEASGHAVVRGGVYGCTQGPRLETAAEIDRMARDGCTLVGMTALPEAVLARELGVPYVSLSLVVNPAAGRGTIEPHAMRQVAVDGTAAVRDIITGLI